MMILRICVVIRRCRPWRVRIQDCGCTLLAGASVVAADLLWNAAARLKGAANTLFGLAVRACCRTSGVARKDKDLPRQFAGFISGTPALFVTMELFTTIECSAVPTERSWRICRFCTQCAHAIQEPS